MYELGDGIVCVGCFDEVLILIFDFVVSWCYVEVYFLSFGFVVEDFGLMNGLFVNGECIVWYVL